MTIAAAGLTLSAAVLMGCGRARGEPSTAEVDSAAAADVAAANADSSAVVSATTPSTATTSTTTAPAPADRSARSNSYEVSPVPSESRTRVRARVRTDRDASAEVAVTEPPATTDVSITSTEPRSTDANVTTTEPRSTDATVTTTEPAVTTSPTSEAATTPMSDADRSRLAGAAAVTACFANDDKAGLEYPSARLDAYEPANNEANRPMIRIDSNVVGTDQAMAPAATVTVTPSDHAVHNNDAAMSPTPAVTAEVTTGRIVPCMKSGDKSGRAAGAFVNDAQIAHASLLANTIDSAVSVAAARRASNPAVREYAEMMIRDHTEANQKQTALLERLRISPAENDISNAMLSEVSVLSAGMNTPSTAERAAMPTGDARVTTPAAAANPSANRDTLHLNNRFVAAANMQPWTSLLAGLGDSAKTDGPAVARPGAVTATVTTTTAAPAAPATVTTSDFDRKYIDYQVNFHQKVLDGLDTRLIPWAGPELRAFLEEARPRVASHLERARELQRSMQSNASNY